MINWYHPELVSDTSIALLGSRPKLVRTCHTLKAVRLYLIELQVSLTYQTATHTVKVATLLGRTQADKQLVVTCNSHDMR